jgi:hypothetical protein
MKDEFYTLSVMNKNIVVIFYNFRINGFRVETFRNSKIIQLFQQYYY